MKLRKLAVATAMATLLATPFAVGQTTLTPDSSVTGDATGTPGAFADAYGVSLAEWRGWVAVGAPREQALRDGVMSPDGAVYIYRRDSNGDLVLQQKIQPEGTSVLNGFGDRFGGAVEIENGWMMIGAANRQDFPADLVDPNPTPGVEPFRFAGQVLVYKLNKKTDTWEFTQTLDSPAPQTLGQFGTRTQAGKITIQSNAQVAVIGELNNFAGGIGEAQVYRRRGNTWSFVQTIAAPDGQTGFADDLLFLENNGGNGKQHILIGGANLNTDAGEFQGIVSMYRQTGNGSFTADPVQQIFGPVYDSADCGISFGFGTSGIDASGGTVAVADPCHSAISGANDFTGAVTVYDYSPGGDTPLSESAFLELDESFLLGGANFFGSRFSIALNSKGDGLLVGTPNFPGPGVSVIRPGDDVRYFTFDPNSGWSIEAFLTSDVPDTALARAFGQSVYFLDDSTAVARHNNTIDPFAGLLDGNLVFFDVPLPTRNSGNGTGNGKAKGKNK